MNDINSCADTICLPPGTPDYVYDLAVKKCEDNNKNKELDLLYEKLDNCLNESLYLLKENLKHQQEKSTWNLFQLFVSNFKRFFKRKTIKISLDDLHVLTTEANNNLYYSRTRSTEEDVDTITYWHSYVTNTKTLIDKATNYESN